MLNTAISMVLYGIIVKTESLGSTDGFAISVPTVLVLAPETKYPAICCDYYNRDHFGSAVNYYSSQPLAS